MLEGSPGKWTGVQLPGSEMAGEVEAVGAGVTRFAVGDKVISVDIRHWIDGPAPEVGTNTAPFPGWLAEYVTVPEDLLVRAPAMLDAVAASTLSVAGLTAWFALVELAKIRAGETVVVQGTGGVALFAVQFAAAHGASVIVVSSSKSKLQRVKALGATHGIDRSEHEDWDARVLEITGGRGADHVLEMGGADITRSVNAIRIGGAYLDHWPVERDRAACADHVRHVQACAARRSRRGPSTRAGGHDRSNRPSQASAGRRRGLSVLPGA